MFRKSSKRVLIAGYLVGIIILLLLVIGSGHISDAHTRYLQEVSEENLTTIHLSEMRDTARKRTNILLQMIVTKDEFLRDELFLELKQGAVRFIEARDAFLSIPGLTRYESETWEQVSELVGKVSTYQNEVAWLLLDGKDEQVLDEYLEELLESQTMILQHLTSMLKFQGVETNSLLNETLERNETTDFAMNMLAVTGVFSFVIVAFIVYRLVMSNEENIRMARQAAENANQAKSAFLANMSHEMRTPLTAILGFSEHLVESQSSDKEQLEAITHISNNCEHLRNMINDVLDLSKIEAGQLIVESECISLLSFTENMKGIFREIAQRKSIKFSLTMSYPVPAYIETDEMRLRQIFVNLIGNAIKFTDNGKISVDISYDRERDLMEVSISDTGIGISEKEIANLFRPYTQANHSVTQQYGGTGLGLAITKQLVEKLGGEIQVESQKGKGSTFRFSIYAGSAAEKTLAANQQDLTRLTKSSLDRNNEAPVIKRRILLAEDNKVNQILISKLLRNTGARVSVVSDGEEVLDILSREEFDLIVMDIKMPNMDGIEATRRLRAKGIDIPIIALTANALIEDKNACIEAGMDFYLTKPIEKEKFYSVLQELSA